MSLTKEEKLGLLVKLRTIKPLTDWNDIKVGEEYHIPPLVYNKRRDFVVISKPSKDIARVIYSGKDTCSTIFRTDITSNFITKKIL